MQFLLRTLRHRLDQLIGKLAAEHRADLRDLLRRRPEPVEPRHQRGMQGHRHRLRDERCSLQHRGPPVALRGAVQHRLGQFLDEERHSVGALDNLRDDIRRQRSGVACEALHHHRAVAPPEPVQCYHGGMRLAHPGRLEFGTKGGHQHDRQTVDPREHEVEELTRSRIDPMQILKNDQHRLHSGQPFELPQQRRKGALLLALRAQLEWRKTIAAGHR